MKVSQNMTKAKQIISALPANWESLPPEEQLDTLLSVSEKIIKPPGNWILLNAEMTFREFLEIAKKPNEKPAT